MRPRRILITSIAAAALIVAAGSVVSFLPTRSGNSVAQTMFEGSGPATPDPADNGAADDVSPQTPSAARSSSSPRPGASGMTKQDNSLITDVGHGGSEQIPTATPTPYRLHPTAAPKNLEASDVTVAPHSKVSSKSIESAEGTIQVLIDATTTTKPADTVAYYQGVFTSLGMTGKPIPAVGGSTAVAFTSGTSTVTLTVSAHDKGSSYLIHGLLRTGA